MRSNHGLTTLLALAGVSFCFALWRSLLSKGKRLPLPRAGEQVILYPARWPYFVCAAGLLVGIGLPGVILYMTKSREFLAWMAMICMGFIGVGPATYGLCTMPGSKIVLTATQLEYHHWKKCDIVVFDKMAYCQTRGGEVFIDYIDSGMSKMLRIPLVFKNSGGLVRFLSSISNEK